MIDLYTAREQRLHAKLEDPLYKANSFSRLPALLLLSDRYYGKDSERA
jgi:hypothetical protein